MRAGPPSCDDERPDAHRRGDERRERVDRGQLDAAVQQRADAEGRDAVAELVEGDHAARDGGRDGGELLLAEADRERQERRAAEAGEAERQHAENGLVVGEQRDEHERAREQEGEDVVRHACR